MRFITLPANAETIGKQDAATATTTVQDCGQNAAMWQLHLAPNGHATVTLALLLRLDHASLQADAEAILNDPAGTVVRERQQSQQELTAWFRNLPSIETPSEPLKRFYYHAAAQLLYDRWRLGRTFLFDPWYPVSGRDSGGMNLYVWDVQYAAQALGFLDPASLRRMLLALPTAPMTEHYAIDPLDGHGLGPFYTYNAYAYTNSVSQYLAMTGDTSLLSEQVAGKTILDWLVTLAEDGEVSRDPGGNNLLDCGDDRNLLELHRTGSGPGYLNEVPSPNGQRAYVYAAVANMMEHVDAARYHAKIAHFRAMAPTVAAALNKVLWLDREGWYGSRQRDGSVVPVYSVQVFELLRFPGLVPRDRAQRLLAHLTEAEFLAGPTHLRSCNSLFCIYEIGPGFSPGIGSRR